MERRSGYFVALVVTTCLLPLVSATGATSAEELPTKIVNGLTTSGFPSVVKVLIWRDLGTLVGCTGTMIGCETVLTAAHCVCQGGLGINCQPGGSGLPYSVGVFAQSAGLFPVEGIAVPAAYNHPTGDVAILRLWVPVDGIAPKPINTVAKPAVGTPGQIVGFGRVGGTTSYETGIKRWGWVETATCTDLAQHRVCWDFAEPLGPPGSNSSTCHGDSGGPLFIEWPGVGKVLAGVTGGGAGENLTCLPPSNVPDICVFWYRMWIQSEGGADLYSTSCGSLPQAGRDGAPIYNVEGTLGPGNTSDEACLPIVPSDTYLVRIALNTESSGEFDLYVRTGSPPTTSDFDCASTWEGGGVDFCEILRPQTGPVCVLVKRVSGYGFYQVTFTVFSPFLFADGFESGDTSAWSETVGGP